MYLLRQRSQTDALLGKSLLKQMKRILPAFTVLFLALMFSVAAEDAEFIFEVSSSKAAPADTAYVTVSISEHNGITGLALNIAYDHETVECVSYDFSPSFPDGLVSVNDNKFGQVRITFAPSTGITYFYGDLITLGFMSLNGEECSSVIKVDDGIATVSDRNYKPSEFVSTDGKVEFTEDPE